MTAVIDAVINAASELYGVDVRKRCRARDNVTARHVAIFILRELGFTFPEIGRAFGVDHTSILHVLRTRPRPLAAGVVAARALSQIDGLSMNDVQTVVLAALLEPPPKKPRTEAPEPVRIEEDARRRRTPFRIACESQLPLARRFAA